MAAKSTSKSASDKFTKKSSSKTASSAKKTKALISKVDAAQPAPARSKKPAAKAAVVVAEKPVEGGKKKKKEKVEVKEVVPDEEADEDAVDEEAEEFTGVGSGKEKAKSKKSKAAVEEDEVEDAEEADSSDEEDAYLHGFSDDGADSSDEDEDVDINKMTLDITKLPTVAKDDETVKRKLDRAKKLSRPGEEKGVISISRLPHGFYEDQLRAYFSQFGEVSRLRMSRNKKTGASKHYAFLEFESLPVATIVAETMNNYLIHGHILKCAVLPKEKVHPDLWIGANRKWRKVPMDRVRREEHNRPRTEDEREKASRRLLKRQDQKKRKLEDSGIKYDFDKVAYKKPKAVAAA